MQVRSGNQSRYWGNSAYAYGNTEQGDQSSRYAAMRAWPGSLSKADLPLWIPGELNRGRGHRLLAG